MLDYCFFYLYSSLIEKSGKDFIEWKLKLETNKKIDSIQLPSSKNFEILFGNKVKQLQQVAENKLENLKKLMGYGILKHVQVINL